jgi:glycosyltransferase 2 family protein
MTLDRARKRDESLSGEATDSQAFEELGRSTVREGDTTIKKDTGGDLFPTDLGRKVVPVVGIAVLLYVAFFVFADARATLTEIGRVGREPLILALAISLVSFGVRAVRWHFLVRQVHPSVPLLDDFLVSFAGLAMTITPGKAGEVLKSLMLKEAHAVPVARSAPLLVLERLCDLLTVVLVTGIGLTQLPGFSLLASLTLAAGVAGSLGAMFMPQLIERFPKKWLESRLVRTRQAKAMDALNSLKSNLAPAPFLGALSLSLLAWGLQSLVVWLFAYSYSPGTVSIAAGAVAYCAPLLAGAIALVPGGLGATEASMAGIILLLTRGKLSLSVAAALTILVRLSTFWLAIGLGLIALSIWRIRAQKDR